MKSLDAYERNKVSDDIDVLRAIGLDLPGQKMRSLGGKLWELRTSGKVEHRLIFYAATGKRFVLLHGFTKKAQRTPRMEIHTARRRMADAEERGI